MDQQPGTCVAVADGVRRVLAPNPSPLTGPGTNSYLVGRGELAVVDPGPDDPAHLGALLEAIAGERVAAILVTHAHLDHSALSRRLAAATGAPVLAFGDARAGRSEAMEALAARGALRGGEGVDAAFAPDRRVADGEAVRVGGMSVVALHTPGHFGNHLSFSIGDVALSGDLVLGWASTLVSPPDGEVAAFLASCVRLRALGARALLPGHGDVVTEPASRIDWLVAHRHEREAQIVKALRMGPATAAGLVERLYVDTPRHLWPAAERNVLAHLIDLAGRGLAACAGPLAPGSAFRLVPGGPGVVSEGG